MVQIAVLLLYAISRIYSGFEDGAVSRTEIELATVRGMFGMVTARKADTIRRAEWHKNGAIKLIFTAMALGLSLGGFNPVAMAYFVAVLSLQVLIFNPIIATKYLDKKFTYLAPNGWDGFFKKTIGEAGYYVLNLLIFIGCVVCIILSYH